MDVQRWTWSRDICIVLRAAVDILRAAVDISSASGSVFGAPAADLEAIRLQK